MDAKNNKDYEEMDEAEEEALLKSDDEVENANKVQTEVLDDYEDDDSDNTNGDSNDDEDDDDDDDNNKEMKLYASYKTLLEEIVENPYVYENYLKLTEISHGTGDLEMIENAYDMFSKTYPLSPELWLKYLAVQMSIAQSPKEIEKVKNIFQKAFHDYYSVEVALNYAELANRCTDNTVIWQEILGTYGLHCTQGKQFFTLYRQQLLKNSNIIEQEDAYINSYVQELKYPLNNMTESYIEFKVYYEKNKERLSNKLNWQTIDTSYFKAKEHLQKILLYENELNALDKNKFRERGDVYKNYIKEADKFLDENILQTVYERMVTDCCLNVDVWLVYINFVEYRDAYGRPKELQDLPVFTQTALDIVNRAIRNCPWSEKLYIKRMLLFEKNNCTREEIQEALENSLAAGFQTAEPAVAIWLEYLTYLHRQTDYTKEDDCEILRKNFNLAWTILGQQWGVLADCNCEILQFWGRLEYGPLNDPKHGKELWTTVMESADNATKSGLWIEFIQLEIHRDLESTRKLHLKALYASDLDNINVITSSWERFERCNGTIESLQNCKEEIAKFMKEHSHYLKTQRNQNKSIKRKSLENAEKDNESKRTKINKTDKPNISRKEEVVEQQHSNQEIDPSKDNLRVFLSNLDYNLNEDDVKNELKGLKIIKIDLIRSSTGRSRGFGYLELENENEVKKALKMDRIVVQGRPLYISNVLRDKEQREKFKYSDGIEPTKLFVKGLPIDTTQQELEELFGKYGKVKDVRLVYHKSGKFKNIAYIEYEEESAASKAVLCTNLTNLRENEVSLPLKKKRSFRVTARYNKNYPEVKK